VKATHCEHTRKTTILGCGTALDPIVEVELFINERARWLFPSPLALDLAREEYRRHHLRV